MRKERSSLTLEEKRIKKRLVKKLYEASKPTRSEDKDFAITIDPINVADVAATPAAKGITIREPEFARLPPKMVPEGKGNEQKESNSFDPSTSSLIKKAKREAQENRLREAT